MGFTLNFFRTPEPTNPLTDSPQAATQAVAARQTQSELERRRLDAPNITEVEPAPEVVANRRPSFEEIAVEPPKPILTTEGGLTGKTAEIRRQDAPRQATPASRGGTLAPPPIPDLNP